jgi:hypothetical protein
MATWVIGDIHSCPEANLSQISKPAPQSIRHNSPIMILRRALLVVGMLVVALMAAAKVTSSNGLDQLAQHLAKQGWEKGQLTLLDAGYSSNIFSQTAHGRYESSDPARLGKVTIKIQRGTPLQAWSVANYGYLPISK